MKRVKPRSSLELLIAIINSNCFIDGNYKGIKEIEHNDGPHIKIDIDYETCHKIVKEWEEICKHQNKD